MSTSTGASNRKYINDDIQHLENEIKVVSLLTDEERQAGKEKKKERQENLKIFST